MISPSWPLPATTRSRVMLEIASVLVADRSQPYLQAKILLREQGAPEWALCLFGSGGIEGIDAVLKREATVAIVNPATVLALAFRGMGPYAAPQPVRAIAVIPSPDRFVFAVRPDTGLETFEDIAVRRYPLKLAVRAETNHAMHCMLDDIAAAAGFTLADVESWGGEIRREGYLPIPGSAKFEALVRGEIDAIIDEAARSWGNAALDAGMRLLSLSEATVQKLEAKGYRRSVMEKGWLPGLVSDILTIDFSGWPIFVHAELPDTIVTQICAALDERKHLIPWQGDGPLPLERMCLDAVDTPQVVPLHPAAERFWRERGYLA